MAEARKPAATGQAGDSHIRMHHSRVDLAINSEVQLAGFGLLHAGKIQP